MRRHGKATLPLHGGSAPPWLFDRMVDLSGAIATVIIDEFGQAELLRRLSDPYWFQAFGCLLGFDWHSSGVTTTTMGALKVALEPTEHGILVAGGKGATSRRTPVELRESPFDLASVTREDLVRSSKLSASVDAACVQDRYELYHHTMVTTQDGDWCVVQQGMDGETARRYHWADEDVDSFVEAPQTAICTQRKRETVLDLTAPGSDEIRDISVDLASEPPARLKRYLEPSQTTLASFGIPDPYGPHLDTEYHLPDRHDITTADLSDRAIAQLEHAYERQVDGYEELVETDGIGRGSLRALALIGELLYDAEAARDDPAKFSYAHGGKDGIPYPVNRDRYDRSTSFLTEMLEGAEVDQETKQTALDRLHAATESITG